MPSTNQITQCMSLAELKSRAEWQILTDKQKFFVQSYIASGIDTGTYDAQFAVQSAYDTAGKTAVILSYELLANRKIQRVLDLHFGHTEMDSLLADLAKAIKQSLRKGELTDATATAIKFFEKHTRRQIPKSKPSSSKKSKKSKRKTS